MRPTHVLAVVFLLVVAAFAEGLPPASPAIPAASKSVAVDAGRIDKHLRQQVELGPRPPSSAASAKLRAMLVRELKSYGLTVKLDAFDESTPVGTVRFTNVIGEKKGRGDAIVLITAHYDTKTFDQFRFVGANDGASGVAGVLEIARVLAAAPPSDVTYRFVFFDGEEAFCHGWAECLDGNDNTYGSRREVERLRSRGEIAKVKAMILLDMIGDRDLRIRRDRSSTPKLTDAIWRAARRLGANAFSEESTSIGGDDHFPFLAAGIPAVDLIDFEYPWWHREGDTLDKVSAESVATVCRVVLASLPEIVK
jgi:glutaminyl-peptide cyclotransferase